MALLNAYLYLLFIDVANFHTWKLDDTTQACLASCKWQHMCSYIGMIGLL